MIPKTLQIKRDALAEKYFEKEGDCCGTSSVYFAYDDGFNAAINLVLESEELKGLVDALKDIAEAYQPGTIAGLNANAALSNYKKAMG